MLLCASLAGLSCTARPATDGPDALERARELVIRGREQLAGGEQTAAELSFRSALDADPANSRAHFYLGYLLDAAGRAGEARQHLHKAAALEPDYAPAQRLLGFLYLNTGQWARSLDFSQRAVELAPQDAAAHVNLAYALQRLGHSERAYFHYQKALALDPRDDRVFLYSGMLLYEMRQVDEARRRFASAIRLNPGNAEAHYRLALLILAEHNAAADRREARQHLLRSIALNPQYGGAHRALGYLELRAGRHSRSIEASRRALELDAGDAAARYNLALALYQAGQYRPAREHFGAILATHPATEDACLYYASASLRLGEVETAIKYYLRTIELNDRNPLAHFNLARIYAARGETGRATDHFKIACDNGDRQACAALP